MTATLPPQSPHFGHHSTYNSHLLSYAANNSIPSVSSQLAPSYSFPNNTPASVPRPSAASGSRQPPHSGLMTNSQSTSALRASRKRDRGPDWDTFYKNGLPKEVIVIDDDSPPPAKRKENTRVNPPKQGMARGNEQMNKKRRTGQGAAYDAARDLQASYSHARTYSNGNSVSDTISTDRTTSLQTTAPTSLGSHTSHGSTGTYIEDSQVGQKRKRVTRLQIADERKRKAIENQGDAYSAYQPPPNPPIKAKEVHVPSIREVNLSLSYLQGTLLMPQQTVTINDKIDDEDGHYIVTEDTPIGDRCKFLPSDCHNRYPKMLTFFRPSRSITWSRHFRQSGRSFRQAYKIQVCHQDYSFCTKVSRCFANRIACAPDSFSQRPKQP